MDGTTRRLVEARLGRPAQDRLEAAVVLEAWSGVRATNALERARWAVRRQSRPVAGDRRGDGPSLTRGGTAEGISLVLAVVAVASWAAPLSAQLGGGVWNTAIRIALPLTLALQWVVWSRYLTAGDGLGTLRHESPLVIAVLGGLLGALCLLGQGGVIAALVLSIWVGGTVLVCRGWIVWYAFTLTIVAVGLRVGVPSIPMLGGAALASYAGVAAALRTSASVSNAPGRLARALGAGAVGAGLGALLITDHTIGWGFRGALPALALVPSALGGFWAGRHLSGVHADLPRALRGVPVARADRIALRGPGLVILAGALVRLIVATATLSVACVMVSPAMSGTVRTSLFIGFGSLALATLLVSLLVSLGRLGWALAIVAVSVGAELALDWSHLPLGPGDVLIAGSTIAAVLVLPLVIEIFVRPGRALATTVWIA